MAQSNQELTADLATATAEQLAACDRVVERVRVARAQGFAVWALGVAQAVVDELYGGDVEAPLLAKNTKGSGLEILIAHRGNELAELDLSSSALRNYLRALRVAKRLPDELSAKLDTTKLQRLDVVKEPALQLTLATEAVTKGWSRSQLDAHLPKGPVRGKGRTSPKRVAASSAAAVDAVRHLGQFSTGLEGLPLVTQQVVKERCLEILAVVQGVLGRLGAGMVSEE